MKSKRVLLCVASITLLLSFGLLTGCKKGADEAAASAPNATAPDASVPNGSVPNAAPGNMNAADNTKPSAAGGESQPPAPQPITIPAGTSISVRLQNAVSSAESHAGDRFQAVLDAPIKVNGEVVAPSGATVTGRVVDAESSGRLQHPGHISLALVAVSADGQSIPIATSTVSAQAQSHKRRNLEWIGGSAAGGALLGGVFGGGKGALVGSAVGAGGGTAAAAATGKKDVGFGAEQRLTFRLAHSVTVPVKG
jgi:hypothetical protein